MPPPMSPQSSRGGLITAVVVLSILFVASAIFAFYYSGLTGDREKTIKNLNDKLNQYASAEAQGLPDVDALVNMRNDPAHQGESAIQIAIKQRNDLDKANKTLTGNNQALDAQVKSLTAEIEKKGAELDEINNKMKDEVAARKKMQDELQGGFNEQGKLLSDAVNQLTEQRTAGTESVTKIQTNTSRAIKLAQGEASKLQQQLADRDGEIAKLKQQNNALLQKIGRPETGDVVIRQPDGKVIRVPGNDNVFINLGAGDHLSPGMTFEVYDDLKGVPPLGEEDLSSTSLTLPKGKASIEVVRVSNGQSEARIIRQSLGQTVVEGDIIANLVYDKNTKYNLVVFGDFDLDQDGRPTPEDNKVIQQKILEWGGRVVPEVTVNTDFVVLGAEPEVPARTDDETPPDIEKRERAQRELEAYEAVRAAAIDLNVPILNQNKFLYYTGYYEQAQR